MFNLIMLNLIDESIVMNNDVLFATEIKTKESHRMMREETIIQSPPEETINTFITLLRSFLKSKKK
jgi:hypothetical protein